jgi:hypothetical protein
MCCRDDSSGREPGLLVGMYPAFHLGPRGQVWVRTQ